MNKLTCFSSKFFLNVLFISSPAAGSDGDITWHKNGEEIDDEEIVSKVDYSSYKLLIKKAKMQDAGKYTCECEFNNGHKSDAQRILYVYGK